MSVLAAATNNAALGIGVLLIGGWVVLGILGYRRAAPHRKQVPPGFGATVPTAGDSNVAPASVESPRDKADNEQGEPHSIDEETGEASGADESEKPADGGPPDDERDTDCESGGSELQIRPDVLEAVDARRDDRGDRQKK